MERPTVSYQWHRYAENHNNENSGHDISVRRIDRYDGERAAYHYYGMQATKTFVKMKGMIQTTLAKVEGVVKGAVKIIARLTYFLYTGLG